MEERVVIQETVAASRSWKTLQPEQGLLGQAEGDLVDDALVRRRRTTGGDGQRGTCSADPRSRSQVQRSPRNPGPQLGGLAQIPAVERPHLAPVQLQHSVGELWDGDLERP